MGKGELVPTWAPILSLCVQGTVKCSGRSHIFMSQSRTYTFLYMSECLNIWMLPCLSSLIKPRHNVTHWGSLSLSNAEHAQVGSCCLSFTSAISISVLPAATPPPSLLSKPAKKIYIVANNHILTHITVWNNFPWTTWGALDSSCQASKHPQCLWDSIILIFSFICVVFSKIYSQKVMSRYRHHNRSSIRVYVYSLLFSLLKIMSCFLSVF